MRLQLSNLIVVWIIFIPLEPLNDSSERIYTTFA